MAAYFRVHDVRTVTHRRSRALLQRILEGQRYRISSRVPTVWPPRVRREF